jgi:signal transduction histidine kinase
VNNKIKPLLNLFRRIPFTLLTSGGLVIAALVTNTHMEQISQRWLDRFGFAPSDLWFWRLERLFTSALVTSGGRVFWQALFFVAFAVGAAEWLAGPKRAAATFWGVHLLTLVLLSLIIALMIDQLHNLGLEASEVARDVGPSAGYFACLGLVSARLKRPWNWVSGGILLVVFLVALLLPAGAGENAQVKFSADLAHLMAFPLGWISSFIIPHKEP